MDRVREMVEQCCEEERGRKTEKKPWWGKRQKYEVKTDDVDRLE